MRKMISFFIMCLLLQALVNAQEQNIKDYIDSYIGENARPYIQPLSDLFASNINTGIWEWSNIDSAFYLRLKLEAIVSYPSESMRTFLGKTTGDFQPEQTLPVPTIIGDRNSIIVQGDSNTFYIFPGGYDLKRLTLGTPQITMGGFLHSEISGRFLCFSLGQDLGKVNFIGIGGRHSLSGYFKDPPMDFSIGYFYHHLVAGTYLENDQHLFSAQIGKSGKFFSAQLMAGYQTSHSEIDYTYVDGEDEYKVNLDLDNTNPWIIEASAGLRMGFMFVTGAVSYAKHYTLSAGVGLFF